MEIGLDEELIMMTPIPLRRSGISQSKGSALPCSRWALGGESGAFRVIPNGFPSQHGMDQTLEMISPLLVVGIGIPACASR